MAALSGKTALVTGGGTGIGEAIAKSFAEAGATVAITGRREEKLKAAVEGTSIKYHACDVGDRESVNELFDWFGKEIGPINILVNSAGVNTQKRSVAELDPADWDKLIRINATGAYNCTYAALPGMREQKDGVIINICSISGIRSGPLGGLAYNASKFAMRAMGITVGVEERENMIRVTNIHPGEVETPILDDRPVPVTAEHRARILQPEDVADAALMVASLPPRARVPELSIIPTSAVFV
jgi:NAD(P)-dependent dehydrogenase (short-subunit alcohol dehydrogenase family)